MRFQDHQYMNQKVNLAHHLDNFVIYSFLARREDYLEFNYITNFCTEQFAMLLLAFGWIFDVQLRIRVAGRACFIDLML